jgi:heptosyltransferase-2
MRILVIRLSSLGDVLMTTPVVRWLKTQIDAEIHFLIKRKFVEVIQHNEFINKIHLYESDGLIEILKQEEFDLVVDLHKTPRTVWLSVRLGVKTFTFQKKGFHKLLYIHTRINLLKKDEHLIDRYANALQPLQVKNDGLGLDFKINPSKVFQNPIPSAYDVLVLGAAHATKKLPIQLCKKIINSSKKIIVLLGGKDVLDISSQLIGVPNVIDLVGKTNLDTSAHIILQADIIYTGDTGLMHLTAALQKPMHVIWGSTDPIFGLYPYYGDKRPLASYHINHVWCRPCTKVGRDSCPLGHFACMNHSWPAEPPLE